MDIGEITGQWSYEDLPANIRVGRDCYFERRDSFGRFRSERSPAVPSWGGSGISVVTTGVKGREGPALLLCRDESL